MPSRDEDGDADPHVQGQDRLERLESHALEEQLGSVAKTHNRWLPHSLIDQPDRTRPRSWSRHSCPQGCARGSKAVPFAGWVTGLPCGSTKWSRPVRVLDAAAISPVIQLLGFDRPKRQRSNSQFISTCRRPADLPMGLVRSSRGLLLRRVALVS
jgi:hypothetical protein